MLNKLNIISGEKALQDPDQYIPSVKPNRSRYSAYSLLTVSALLSLASLGTFYWLHRHSKQNLLDFALGFFNPGKIRRLHLRFE